MAALPLAPPESSADLPASSGSFERRLPSRRAGLRRLALPLVLLLALGLRAWGASHDLPFSYYGDELHFMKRAMALGTGDLNPHWFHKPAFLMYALAFTYGLYFAVGRVTGVFDSTAEFGARFLTEPMAFLVLGRLVVLLCGVATVYLVYRIGVRVYGERAAGLAGALATAVLAPMIASSVVIKSDVPCGLLITLAVYFYLGTRDTERLRPLVLAALAAGAAMGTHYYGVVLVPAFVALEGLRGLTRQTPWGRVILRCALVGGLFVAGFFLTSPFNFLDPTWGATTFKGVQRSLGLTRAPVTHYEPDSKTEFKPGPSAWGGAAVAFFRMAARPDALGLALGLLALVGLGVTLARRETRWYGLLVLIPCLFFFLAAITVAAYHAQPRHLNAVYPLLASVVWPGALALTAGLRRRLGPERARLGALALVGLACLPTLVESVRWVASITRLDSRLVSYRWIQKNLSPGEHILVDDYGPILNPNRLSLARQRAKLRSLPESPFIHHQDLRLDLLSRYPPADGMNLDELGHQWWLPREKSDAELASNPSDLDMGNPLVSRQPRPLDAYRAQGVRYVITNHDAQEEYYRPRGKGFPSYVAFYNALHGTKLVRTFDPDEWGGKGPTVWVYDLTRPAVPGQGRLERIPKRKREIF